MTVSLTFAAMVLAQLALTDASNASHLPQSAAGQMRAQGNDVSASRAWITIQDKKGTVRRADAVATITRALRNQLVDCWQPPGGDGDKSASVRVRISLDRTGKIKRAPQILDKVPDQLADAIAKSALSAVQKCSPFDLPAEHYELWRELVLNFNTSHMFDD